MAPVLTVAALPYTPLSGSPSSLLVNADGQIAVICRSEIHILTPSFGIQVDASHLRKATPRKEDASVKGKGKGKAKEELPRTEMPLFQTPIPIEKKDIIDWSGWTDNLAASSASKGTVEAMWRTATWSPTSTGQLGGCVMAATTSNHEALLFEPLKNSHRGEWKETFDFTSTLARLLLPHSSSQEDTDESMDSHIERTLKVVECQATCIAWSEAVEGVVGDFSLLAIGHKSGHVSLWRRSGVKMEVLHRYRVDNEAQWIKALSWSPWQLKKNGSKTAAVSFLAVGDSSGSVWDMEITQDVSSSRVAGDNIDQDARGVNAAQPLIIGKQDGRQVTQFCWIFRDDVCQLAYTKLGTLNIVTFAPATEADSATTKVVSEEVELDLELLGASIWIGANNLSPACGIVHIPTANALVVGLASSSFYVVTLDPQPAFVAPEADLPTSLEVIAIVRHHFSNLPSDYGRNRTFHLPDRISKREGAAMKGFAAFGDERELAWLQEVDLPDRTLYRPNGGMRTRLVISPLLAGSATSEEMVASFRSLLSSPPNARVKSSIASLRPLLHYISDNPQDPTLLDLLFEILSEPAEDPPEQSNDSIKADAALEAMLTGLFGDPCIERLRLKETVARFLKNLPQLHASYFLSASLSQANLSRRIGKELMGRVGNILTRAESLLTSEELSTSGRMLVAAASLLLDDSPESQSPFSGPDALSASFDGTENCPACKASVPLASIGRAQCLNGHQWERCSLTLSILSTITLRTCTGCERKSLIPREVGDDQESAGLLNLLLKVATCCLFCGGRWMRIR